MYQPRPLEKRSVAPGRPQPRLERPATSIVINTQALSQLTDERARREAEVVEALASFIPLSSTPAPGRLSDEALALPARELVRERPLDPAALAATGRASDFSSSGRRALLTGALALAALWFGFLASRVGLDRALREPLRASRVALLGELEAPAPAEEAAIEEVIESGEVSARVVRVLQGRQLVAVEGEVENSTSRAQANIQLTLKLTFTPKGAPRGAALYTQAASFSCCEAAPEALTEAWLAERGRREAPAAPAAFGGARVEAGERLRFVHVAPAPRALGEGALEAALSVSFYEKAE